jgi:hypothetical protein
MSDTEKSQTMQKVVINNKHGGFGLSEKALDRLVEEYGFETTDYDDGEYRNPDADIIDGEGILGGRDYFLTDDSEYRDHPAVIEVVEQLGVEASGDYADLKVVEIPEDVEWEIKEYDGNEWVAEKHRTWS